MHHAGRLHLIAGEQDPEVSDSLTAEEYLRIRKLISAYYSVALIDCGTGVTHNAMSGILQSADNLIIAAGYAVSGAKRAYACLCPLRITSAPSASSAFHIGPIEPTGPFVFPLKRG